MMLKFLKIFLLLLIPALFIAAGEVVAVPAMWQWIGAGAGLALVAPVVPVAYESGSSNLAGLYGKVAIIAHKDITAWPTLAADLVTYTGDFTLAVGKLFEEIYFTHETGGIMYKSLGEIDNGCYEHNIEFEIPALNKDNLAFSRAIVNGDFVLVVTDANGERFVLGTELIGAKRLEVEGNGGKKGGDKRGVMYKFRSVSDGVPVRYEGLFDATIVNPAV